MNGLSSSLSIKKDQKITNLYPSVFFFDDPPYQGRIVNLFSVCYFGDTNCIKERKNKKLQWVQLWQLVIIFNSSGFSVDSLCFVACKSWYESVSCYVLTQPSSHLVVRTPHCKIRLTYSVEKRDKGLWGLTGRGWPGSREYVVLLEICCFYL